ncbi:hypothetical protein F5Y14DRAFT_319384 [Nemania sp. NC0429]|nr:hypothetical protein F5Y14DRAFT_319384 [Nemania sp. NC0429]
MELNTISQKQASRIVGKPERPYIESLKPHAMDPRRRPLRTYSKRTASIESAEPASKRPCIASPPKSSPRHGAATSTRKLPPHPPHLPTPSPPPPPAKRGTITAYFGKIVSQPAVVVPSADSLTESSPESNGPTCTPPSSPSATMTRRRRARRLKTRVAMRRADESAASDAEQESEDGGQQRMGESHDGEKPPARLPAALSEITPNDLNYHRTPGGMSRDDGGGYAGENRRRGKKTPSVQTTLSLSARETQYTECRECGMLYNHLHKADVKYHARRHAALRRAKMRAETTSHVTTP